MKIYFTNKKEKSRKKNFIIFLLLILFITMFIFGSNNLLLINHNLNFVKSNWKRGLGIQEDRTVSSISDAYKFLNGAISGIINPYPTEKIDLIINQKNLLQIIDPQSQRKQFPVKISILNKEKTITLPGKARAKGDRKLHKEFTNAQSYRVNLKNNNNLFGLEKFSIQKPLLRGYSWEYLISKTMASEGLLALKSIPVRLSKNGDYEGINTIEEVPSSLTLERNKRKSGPIFGLEEIYGTETDSILDVYEFKKWQNSELYLFSKKVLKEQFFRSRSGLKFDSHAFDMNEWAKFFALNDVFGSYHGTVPKSVKFYYNPVIGKFQPLLFDAHKGAGNIKEFILSDFDTYPNTTKCEWICIHKDFYKAFFLNDTFYKNYINYLEKYNSKKFIDNVEKIYLDNFKQLDNSLYAEFSPSDGISFRGLGLYLFKFSDFSKIRAEIIRKKIIKLKENKALISPMISRSDLNTVIADPSINIVNYDSFSIVGTNFTVTKPTILILSGETLLQGQDKNNTLKINGPLMIVQTGGNITIKNVEFNINKQINPSNRNWSGALNILYANANIFNLGIFNSQSEDAINIVNSNFFVKDMFIKNAKSDAIDLDFSSGKIINIHCEDIGNDCLDASESKIEIGKIKLKNVLDKGISAGENSNVTINEYDGNNVSISMVAKDGSKLKVGNASISNGQLAIASFVKKPSYSSPHIEIKNIFNKTKNKELKALISHTSTFSFPNSILIIHDTSQNIKNRMYGAEFGQATVK